MAHQVSKWQASDGTLHNTECEAKRHDAAGQHKCPKCYGLGRVNGEPKYGTVYDADATAWGGQFAAPVYTKTVVGYVQDVCDVCNGEGWTVEEKQPITETKVIGWK